MRYNKYLWYTKKGIDKRQVCENTILIVGSAENRKPVVYDSDSDMPYLLNSDGSIYDDSKSKSDFELNKNDLFKLLNIKLPFNYITVDPSYTLEIKNIYLEDTRYKGHINRLFSDIKSVIYTNIVIMGCYQDFFNSDNVNKLQIIMNSDSKLLIYNNIDYDTELLERKFDKLNL